MRRVALLALGCSLLAACTCAPAGTGGGIGEDPAPTAITIPAPAPTPSTSAVWVPAMPTGYVPYFPEAGAGETRADAGAGTIVKNGGSDPLEGRFSLADAVRGVTGTGALVARIDTPRGTLDCKLYEDKAPRTVANFVGLARGLRPWKNDRGQWVKRPLYDGTTFHRIIKSFMIQGGDPIGDGVGEIGYTIDDEIWPGATHDRPGLLCMANKGKNTNASQFFILDAPALHLDAKGYTIFGECSPVSRVHDLGAWPVSGDKAVNAPLISRVTIARDNR